MLRSRVSTTQLAARRFRSLKGFSTNSPVWSDQIKVSIPVKKTTHHFRNFVIGSFVLSTSLVGAGVWYSFQNEQFHDIFVDYVPGAEQIVAYIEEQQYKSKASKDFNLPSETNVKVKIPKAGVEARAVSAIERPSPVTSAVGTKKPLTPAVVEQKVPVVKTAPPASSAELSNSKKETAPVQKKNVSLPLIRVASDVDPEIKKSVESLNQLIQAVNQSKASHELVAQVSKDVTELGESITAIRAKYKVDLEKALDSQAAKFAGLTEQRTKDLRQSIEGQEKKWSEEFQKEQQRIVELYNNRLNTEIEGTKKSVIALANNRIISVVTEQERQIAREISERVEKERDGRLSRLSELHDSVSELNELVLGSSDIISQSDNYVKYHLAAGSLANVLRTASEPSPLAPYLDSLTQSLPDDPLVKAVVESVPLEAAKYGVLTNSQLAARFKLLEPEIRRASLLPPDAGVAGHLGSWVFSKLLWKKEGNPIGEDVESIIARTETALSEGRVADAVGELNALKGWPKLLAGDWIKEARKKSEVEFLSSVLSTEGQLWTLSGK